MRTSGKLTDFGGSDSGFVGFESIFGDFELADQKEANSSEFNRGLIFYLYSDQRFIPQGNEDRKTWIKGFCFAINSPLFESRGKTIKEALINCGVTVMQLAELLQVANELATSLEEKWWPQIPVR